MSVAQIRTTIEDAGEAVQLEVIQDGEGGKSEFEVVASDDAAVLAISLTAAGPEGHNFGPQNVALQITDPEGRDWTQDASRTNDGRIALIVDKPMPGAWKIVAEYDADSAGEVNVGLLRKTWREKLVRMGRWLGCKSCKILLRALIIALLVHIGPLAAGGASVMEIVKQLPGALLAALKQTMTLSEDGLPGFLTGLLSFIDGPIDGLLHRICAWLGLCEPIAAEAMKMTKLTFEQAGQFLRPVEIP